MVPVLWGMSECVSEISTILILTIQCFFPFNFRFLRYATKPYATKKLLLDINNICFIWQVWIWRIHVCGWLLVILWYFSKLNPTLCRSRSPWPCIGSVVTKNEWTDLLLYTEWTSSIWKCLPPHSYSTLSNILHFTVSINK